MISPIRFIFGYKQITVSSENSASLVNVCMEMGITYTPSLHSENCFSVICSLWGAKRLESALIERGIEVLEIRERGIPSILGRYRRRWGIFVGALCFALIIFLSGRVIWDVRIDGERTLSENEVIELLEVCGLQVGKRISTLKADTIANRAIIMSDDISWMSVNIIGTVAHVEIRETQYADRVDEPDAANLVASRDGEIVLFEEVRGNIVTEIGDTVRAGDLLVSGLYGDEEGGFRYACAKGRVLARTKEEFSAEIPLQYDKKVYTDSYFCEKYLIFFGKEIKFFSNTRNLPSSCDTIDTVEYLDIFSMGKLPVGIRTVRYMEYEYQRYTRSPESALELALYKLRCSEQQMGMNDILSREFHSSLSEDSYTFSCITECICDIARQVEIEVSDTRGKQKKR